MYLKAASISVLLVSIVSAQPAADAGLNRVFYFGPDASVQDHQEVATVIRSMTNIQSLATDATHKTMTVTAAPAQLEMAEWLFDELVKPSVPRRIYRVSETADDVAAVLHLPPAMPAQDLQEVAATIRMIIQVPRLFIYNQPRTIALRGTAAQIAQAEWLSQKLIEQPDSREREYQMTDERLRVFFLTGKESVQDLQEIATLIRALADIRWLSVFSSPRALIVRGSAEQTGLAAWIFSELANPPVLEAKREYRLNGSAEVARVFYLRITEPPATVQQMAVQVRSAAGIRRLFIYNSARALAMRATPQQMDQVEQLLKERGQ